MKSLAKGNSTAVFKLIKVLINTQQNDYEEAIGGDTTDLLDVASQLETDRSLFGENDKLLLTGGRDLDLDLTRNEDNKWDVDVTSVREDVQGKKYRLGVPGYVNEQIHGGNKTNKEQMEEITKFTGSRSAHFEQLLQKEYSQPLQNPAFVKQRILENRYRY